MILDPDSAIFVGPVRDNRRLWTLDQRFADESERADRQRPNFMQVIFVL